MTLCSVDAEESILDFHLSRALKPFLNLKTVKDHNICNPYNFKDTPKVTTFVRSASSHTHDVLKSLERASKADPNVRLVELEHPFLKKCKDFARASS